jgi:hypothetical protein
MIIFRSELKEFSWNYLKRNSFQNKTARGESSLTNRSNRKIMGIANTEALTIDDIIYNKSENNSSAEESACAKK